MGFLDEIKNKMHLGGQQGYDQGYSQDDDYGYDDGYDDGYQGGGYSGASGEGFYTQDEPSNGLLGQTRRGEAESVAVYTRSGQLVGDDSRHATTSGGNSILFPFFLEDLIEIVWIDGDNPCHHILVGQLGSQ